MELSGSQPQLQQRRAPVVQAEDAGKQYRERAGTGVCVVSHNNSLEKRGPFEKSSTAPLGMRCAVTADVTEDFENISQRYRYMFTTLDERARALDRQLLRLQSKMCSFASIDEADLQPVGVPSQDPVWVCGRIRCDGDGRLNSESVLLEGSRRDSGGRTVKLKLSEAPSYSLFPGQTVLVEGVCSSGREMVVKRVIEGVVNPTPLYEPLKLKEFHHSRAFQGGRPLSIISAAGPFTTPDSLDYEPLTDLLLKVLREKPDVLILTGPFVDVSQPLLASGDVQLIDRDDDNHATGMHGASYEMVFVERIIRDGLGSMFNSEEEFGELPTNIILIPSLLDAHHEFVYPQPPFGDRDRVDTTFYEEPLGVLQVPFSTDRDPRKRVHMLPNPCMFRSVGFAYELLDRVTYKSILTYCSVAILGHAGVGLMRSS